MDSGSLNNQGTNLCVEHAGVYLADYKSVGCKQKQQINMCFKTHIVVSECNCHTHSSGDRGSNIKPHSLERSVRIISIIGVAWRSLHAENE